MLITRLSEIDKIYKLENEFFKKNKVMPINLSTWASSNEFSNYMNSFIELPGMFDAVEYRYSYNIGNCITNKVLEKIGVYNEAAGLIFTQNNTISIVNIVNFVKKLNKKRIGIINPAYFTIKQSNFAFDLICEEIAIEYNSEYEFKLPSIDNLIKYDVIWITSPVFSVGQYFNNDDIKTIKNLIQHGVLVITDESYSIPGNELVRDIGISENFIAIYSPHKSININSLKFSIILCHNRHIDLFEHWLDVFSGNLSFSNICAINHFISNNFELCVDKFEEYIALKKEKILNLLLHHPEVYYCKHFTGGLSTLFFPAIRPSVMQSEEFLRTLMFKTCVSIIPGYLNGFDHSMGFCFRLNLACVNVNYLHGLKALLVHLKKY